MTAWDQLSRMFDTHMSDDAIHPSVADNVILAWPRILSSLTTALQSQTKKKMRVLDFGCGAGGFCLKLSQLGYNVVGYDTSKGMIAVARKNLPKKIVLYEGDVDDLVRKEEANFDAITSIMVFQFVDDLESTLSKLCDMLSPGGALCFAVFNPDYIRKNCTPTGGFKLSSKHGHSHLMLLGDGDAIPLHARSESEYKAVLRACGFKMVGHRAVRPRFTKEFLQKYPQDGSDVSSSEYLVFTCKKDDGRS